MKHRGGGERYAGFLFLWQRRWQQECIHVHRLQSVSKIIFLYNPEGTALCREQFPALKLVCSELSWGWRSIYVAKLQVRCLWKLFSPNTWRWEKGFFTFLENCAPFPKRRAFKEDVTKGSFLFLLIEVILQVKYKNTSNSDGEIKKIKKKNKSQTFILAPFNYPTSSML